ncbi:MAG: beta-N-acetylhexosaminidase [Halobacteriovoraceae bacterium]|nr:beta-N-acetylhexosaminidase [Halobacteriovoraceae bacterium]
MIDIGQLILMGIEGKSLHKEEADFIKKENIGGIILFSKNYETPVQLAQLVNSIQKLRKDYPLFISVDHEGGRVIRFRNHFTQFPPMLDIARLDSPKCFYSLSKIMAEELLLCGINFNFSPCCDILTNDKNIVIGDRAFGKDSETVSKFISSAIRGFQTNGMVACAKHFPGHGSTYKDSHFDLPQIDKELDEFRENEFIPFKKAIKSRVEFIMMGHLLIPSVDPSYPASLSEKWHDILRKELKFDRLIISDDLQMEAITKHYTLEEASIMALSAGSDILIYRDFEHAKKGHQAIIEGLKDKRLSTSQIYEKNNRILDCKKRFFKEYKPVYVKDIEKKLNIESSKVFLKDLTNQISSKTQDSLSI